MKTVSAFTLAAGLVGSANAFSLDFSSFAVGTQLNNSIVVPVPGYGNVRFTEAASPASDLEIAAFFGGLFQGINVEDGEKLYVTFEAGPVTNIEFAFAGVGAGESFTTSIANSPDDGTRSIDFTGESAALIAVNFDAAPVPEPSSTLLVALSALGLVARRRR